MAEQGIVATTSEQKRYKVVIPKYGDVFLQDQSTNNPANVLLTDLIMLHRYPLSLENAGNWSQERLEKLAEHLIDLLKNGTGVNLPQDKQVPPSFPDGNGQFLQKEGEGLQQGWRAVDDETAKVELIRLIKNDTSAIKIQVESDIKQGKADLPKVAVDSQEDASKSSPMEITLAREMAGEKDGPENDTEEPMPKRLKTGEPTGSVLVPNSLDIKLLRNGFATNDSIMDKFKKQEGNQHFLRVVQQCLDTQVGLTLTSPREDRINTTLKILRLCGAETLISKGAKNRFLVLGLEDPRSAWIELDTVAAAEFVLIHLFSKLVEKDRNTAVADLQAADLQALIPTVGDPSQIASFLDFSKPSIHPVESPTEFDVLFGRGGMTNNHPGNRRFRDIISLHRPDYVRAIKVEKPNVARRIVAAIRGGNPPGRFLKRNPQDLKWYDVGNKHATEKTSQALREKSNAEKNGRISTEGDVRKRLLEQAIYEARVTRQRLSKESNGAAIATNCLDSSTLSLLVPKYVSMQAAHGVTGIGPLAGNIASTNNAPGNAAAEGTTIADAVTAAPGAAPAQTDSTTKPAQTNGETPENDAPKTNKPESLVPKQTTSILDVAVLVDKNALRDEGSEEPSTSKGVVDSEGNIVVTENDILCGRGGLTNHHKGNKRFRDIVALHRPDYVRAAKIHKPAVARLIVRAIRNSDPPGRFLKKDDKTSKWFDIGDKRAAEKASQALREKTPEERSRLRQESITTIPGSSNVSDTAPNAAPNSAAVTAVAAAAAVVAASVEAATTAAPGAGKEEQISKVDTKEEAAPHAVAPLLPSVAPLVLPVAPASATLPTSVASANVHSDGGQDQDKEKKNVPSEAAEQEKAAAKEAAVPGDAVQHVSV